MIRMGSVHACHKMLLHRSMDAPVADVIDIDLIEVSARGCQRLPAGH